ncbi:N-acetylmuramoyl-L-alanine amidase [Megasphaera paucivorans]|uniref:N-acetylmuramoyl-L-alanine amidase n=1 Tax=Megasphaera paucivorans TaxID=349095 RepID=A0A1G9VJZ0_9FIRM|nr:N-acetylmuramoyl-L-alanine amidase [Megasphaera paucivorans]SDM72426.1 N-acetylmuramoyl-L-alanine amidase [Megasphaera paucivorans]
MFKKLLLIPILAIMCICPLFPVHAANSTITNVKVVTRNDAEVPFVRTVLEVTNTVKPKAVLDNTGKYITISLPNTQIADGVAHTYTGDKNVISQISLAQHMYATDINIRVPQVLNKNDIKIFSLSSDYKNGRPNRIVIDINDKSGTVKQWRQWQSKQQYQGSGAADDQNVTAYAVPAYNLNNSYSLTSGLKGKIICIDPGHGGSDSGALGAFSKEKDITLAISMRLKKLLEQAGAKVIMTRTTDVDVYAPNDGAVEELQARCDVANAAGADVFVCIHIDSYSTPDVGGVTAYYNNKTPYDLGLAKYIHKENMKATAFPDRGVQTANFYVLLHTNMPATLVELGFISNPSEEKTLNTDAQQQNFAESICQGLSDYFQNSGK